MGRRGSVMGAAVTSMLLAEVKDGLRMGEQQQNDLKVIHNQHLDI